MADRRRQFITERRSNIRDVQQRLEEHVDEGAVTPHSCCPVNVICQFCGSRNFAMEQPQDKKFIVAIKVKF